MRHWKLKFEYSFRFLPPRVLHHLTNARLFRRNEQVKLKAESHLPEQKCLKYFWPISRPNARMRSSWLEEVVLKGAVYLKIKWQSLKFKFFIHADFSREFFPLYTQCLKIIKTSHFTLPAKRASFTFWVAKS